MIYTTSSMSKRESIILWYILGALVIQNAVVNAQEQPARPWLRSRQARPQSGQPAIGVARELPIDSSSLPPQTRPSNRTARTADIFSNGDGYNIFVTNTCERESMKINIKTTKPFNGVIHTKDYRQKPECSVTGHGETEFNLEISNVLNKNDSNHCGVQRAARESPEDKDLLSVIVAVHVHPLIDRADDKFFLLNCTNRCLKSDCSSQSGSLIRPNGNLKEEENSPSGEREDPIPGTVPANQDGECTIWKFPGIITLLWCMAILLVAMLISHCIMCSSLVCKCIRTEVEEREPSVYEGATDNEEASYNKRHPYRIEYDNRDIYKTSNNYQPYTLNSEEMKSKHNRQRRRK